MNITVTMDNITIPETQTNIKKNHHVADHKILDDEVASICTSTSETSSSSISTLHAQTYRYKYTREMTEILSQFARDNMNAEKHEFMASWKMLLRDEKVDQLIKKETELLESSGYVGPVCTKMYKSVRYYFLKKARIEADTSRILNNIIKENETDKHNPQYLASDTSSQEETSTEKKRKLSLTDESSIVAKKRAYYKIDKSILSQMDNFIKSEINNVDLMKDNEEEQKQDNNKEEDIEDETVTEEIISNKQKLKPSVMYEKFCEKNSKLLQDENERMVNEGYPKEVIITKIKKTFKNRCYTIFTQKNEV